MKGRAMTKATDFRLTGTASVAALALGAGLGGLDEAEAAIIFTDLDATISDGVDAFDIDDNPGPDIKVFDKTGIDAGVAAAKNFYLSLINSSPYLYLDRFDVGDTIDNTTFAAPDNFSSNIGEFFEDGFGGASPWLDGQSGFFGFFREGPKGKYFGYVEARFEPDNTVFLGRAAFQNTPNTPITINAIPAPGTLGLLALGAAGLMAHRRRRQRERDV